MLTLLAACKNTTVHQLVSSKINTLGPHLERLLSSWMHIPGRHISPSICQSLNLISTVTELIREAFPDTSNRQGNWAEVRRRLSPYWYVCLVNITVKNILISISWICTSTWMAFPYRATPGDGILFSWIWLMFVYRGGSDQDSSIQERGKRKKRNEGGWRASIYLDQ